MNLLDKVQPFIPALNARETTIRAVAQAIGCNESLLSRTLKGHLDRIAPSSDLRKSHRKLLECRRLMREKHAKLVLTHQKSLKKAAADAKCSERTIRRYMEKVDAETPHT